MAERIATDRSRGESGKGARNGGVSLVSQQPRRKDADGMITADQLRSVVPELRALRPLGASLIRWHDHKP